MLIVRLQKGEKYALDPQPHRMKPDLTHQPTTINTKGGLTYEVHIWVCPKRRFPGAEC